LETAAYVIGAEILLTSFVSCFAGLRFSPGALQRPSADWRGPLVANYARASRLELIGGAPEAARQRDCGWR
jgi:hypothetical protein